MKTTTQKQLICPCGATAKDTSTERGRFYRRHPLQLTPDIIERMDAHISDCKAKKAAAEAKAAVIAQKARAVKTDQIVGQMIVSAAIRLIGKGLL